MSIPPNEIPQRQPEGWAVIDQLGHARLVGRVQTIKMGEVVLLELEQPTILQKQSPYFRDSDGPEGDLVVMETHRVTIHPSTIYRLYIVPSQDYCIRAFFEHHAHGIAEGPGRWGPDAQRPFGSDDDPNDFDDDDIPI